MSGSQLPAPARRSRGRVIFWVSFVICGLACAGGIVTASMTTSAVSVPSTSMANTVRPGDQLLVDSSTQVRRGDVIVEQQGSTGSFLFLRRAIGLPGDRVACCNAQGRISVDGKPLDETYVYPGNAPSLHSFNVTVPSGKLFLLGDHRSLSLDSQLTGPVAVRVIGRAFLVLRGGSHVILLSTPPTFVADGLAPPDTRLPPGLLGSYVSGVALVLMVVLAVVGVVRYVIRRRRQTRTRLAAPALA